MGARQQLVEETREKITAATMSLHERIGPRHTTVSGIAQEAGVTRLTVYRHFPDESALVAACSTHWAGLHPRPDVARWQLVEDPMERLRAALLETYGWARTAAPMMRMIHRDLDVMPAFVADFLTDDERQRVTALVQPFHSRGGPRRRVTTVIRHALDLRTWESLCLQGALSDDEATEAMQAAVSVVLPA